MSQSDKGRGLHDEVREVLGVEAAPVAQGWRWPRRAAFVLVLFLVAVGGYYLVGGTLSGAKVRYRTEPVSRATITVVVTATGKVEPTNTVEISSELSGIVRSVNVDYNSEIKAGDVLAELDTDKLDAAVESSRARLQAARAYVLEAEATVAEKASELDRNERLAERRVIAGHELETTRAAHARALAALARSRADVTAATADLKLNETNRTKSCICSPIDGFVLNRNVEPGQVVAATLQAPVLFTIAGDLTQMEVQVDVDEADVGKVRVGQSATFTVDAYPGRTFAATLGQLRFGSEVVQGVVTYKAVLIADNPDLLLRPGMTATAEIVVDEAKGVLTVSNEALRFSPSIAEAPDEGADLLGRLLGGRPRFRPASRRETSGPKRQIWILGEDIPEAVVVTAGATDGSRTQIEGGPLAEGQKVIFDEITP